MYKDQSPFYDNNAKPGLFMNSLSAKIYSHFPIKDDIIERSKAVTKSSTNNFEDPQFP